MFKKSIFRILCLLGILSITSCASINSMLYKGKCTGNAEKLGESQGALFLGADSYNSWVEKCKQFGVTPDKNQYLTGLEKGSIKACGNIGSKEATEGVAYSAGSNCTGGDRESAYKSAYNGALGKYCNEDNALAFGKSGKEFNGSICPSESKSKLRTAYLNGIAYKENVDEQNKLTKEINGFKDKLKNPKLPEDIRSEYTNMVVDREIKLEKVKRKLDEGNSSSSTGLNW